MEAWGGWGRRWSVRGRDRVGEGGIGTGGGGEEPMHVWFATRGDDDVDREV